MPTMRQIDNMAVPTPRMRGQDPHTYAVNPSNVPEYPEDTQAKVDYVPEVHLPYLKLGSDVSWKLQGACLDSGVDFFPDVLKPKLVATMKAVCAGCGVREQCLQFAVDNEIDYYIFGGMTPSERKASRGA